MSSELDSIPLESVCYYFMDDVLEDDSEDEELDDDVDDDFDEFQERLDNIARIYGLQDFDIEMLIGDSLLLEEIDDGPTPEEFDEDRYAIYRCSEDIDI